MFCLLRLFRLNRFLVAHSLIKKEDAVFLLNVIAMSFHLTSQSLIFSINITFLSLSCLLDTEI